MSRTTAEEAGAGPSQVESLRASRVFVALCAPALLALAVSMVLVVPGMLHPGTVPVVLAAGLLAPPVAALTLRLQRRTGRAQGWWSVWSTALISVLTLCVADAEFRQTAVMALVVGPLYAAMFTSARSMVGHLALAVATSTALVSSTPGPGVERVFRAVAVEMVLVLTVTGLLVLRRRLDAAVCSAEAARDRAAHLADHDPLTGLLNRRGLHRRLLERRPTGLTGAVLVDVDHFKSVNDRWGHAAGDDVLVRVAAVLAATLRPDDLLARVGGEEFLVITTGAGAPDVADLAERLRAAVAADRGPRPVTISAGVALCRPGPGIPCLLDELNARADTLLYRAKAEGRNRVCVQDPPAAREPEPSAAR